MFHRPWYITMIAVLAIIFCAIYTTNSIQLLVGREELSLGSTVLLMERLYGAAGSACLAVGLLSRKHWGWYLAQWVSMFWVMMGVHYLFRAWMLELAGYSIRFAVYFQNTVQLVIFLLVFGLMWRQPIFSYFQMRYHRWYLKLLIVLGAAFIFTALKMILMQQFIMKLE